jgi:hypothetical protein
MYIFRIKNVRPSYMFIFLVGREGHDGTIGFPLYKNKENYARNCIMTTICLEITVSQTRKILCKKKEEQAIQIYNHYKMIEGL